MTFSLQPVSVLILDVIYLMVMNSLSRSSTKPRSSTNIMGPFLYILHPFTVVVSDKHVLTCMVLIFDHLTRLPHTVLRYYHNYYVHGGATKRTYYPGLFRFIQCSKKVFIEKDLCERFATQMAIAWYVALN